MDPTCLRARCWQAHYFLGTQEGPPLPCLFQFLESALLRSWLPFCSCKADQVKQGPLPCCRCSGSHFQSRSSRFVSSVSHKLWRTLVIRMGPPGYNSQSIPYLKASWLVLCNSPWGTEITLAHTQEFRKSGLKTLQYSKANIYRLRNGHKTQKLSFNEKSHYFSMKLLLSQILTRKRKTILKLFFIL